MNRPEAILFDAGGTLVTMHPERFGDLVEPVLGRRPDADQMLDAHYQAMQAITDNAHLLAEGANAWWPWWLGRYLQLAGLEDHPDAVEALASSHSIWRHPLPGAVEGVAAVVEAGFRVAVVSNADGRVEQDLEAAGFGHLFDVVVDSSIVGVSKPDPTIFTYALEALGVDAGEAWYVGDSLVFDLAGAQAAGLGQFVLVDPVGIDHGYDPTVARIGEILDLLPQ